MRRALLKCDFVSFVTKEYLQSRYPTTAGVILACPNVQIPEPEIAVLDKRLCKIEARRRPIIFGTLGSLEGSQKGIRDAIESLAILREQIPEFQYQVVGGGNQRSYLELARKLGLQERVIFHGSVPAGVRVLDWLDTIDVYLHPSHREGVPRAIIEAMSRGCPVIASSVGGTSELIDASNRHPAKSIPSLVHLLRKTTNPTWQISQAQVNWHAARAYSQNELSPKRDSFGVRLLHLWDEIQSEPRHSHTIFKPIFRVRFWSLPSI